MKNEREEKETQESRVRHKTIRITDVTTQAIRFYFLATKVDPVKDKREEGYALWRRRSERDSR